MLELEIIKENIKNGANEDILHKFVDSTVRIHTKNGTISVEPKYKYLRLREKVEEGK